jgi:hypothetical protein
MNPLLNPTTPRPARPNLEKVHKLVQSQKNHAASSASSKPGLPTNWFYDEFAAAKFWHDLEAQDTERRLQLDDQNQFKQISASADRIREAIARYEAEDQCLLIALIELVVDDTAVESLDRRDILLDARQRLYQMILEHSEKSDLQGEMLDSLRSWLQELARGRLNRDPDLVPALAYPKEERLAELADLSRRKAEHSERALGLHDDIVASLLRRIRGIRETLAERETQIARMTQAQQLPSRGRRRAAKTLEPGELELVNAHRRAAELQSQVSRLKRDLSDAGIPQRTEDVKVDEPEIPMLSVEKEIEYEQQISLLSSEVRALKREAKELQKQVASEKQNQMALEKRLRAQKITKKVLESNLATANANLQQQALFEARIKEMELQQAKAKPDESMSVLKTTQAYDHKMEEMAAGFRNEVARIRDAQERKYRDRLDELSAAFQSGDSNKMFMQAIRQLQEKNDALQAESRQQLDDQKQMYTSQNAALKKNYEQILKRRDQDQQNSTLVHKSDLEIRLHSQKVELEGRYNKAMIAKERENTEAMSDMREQFVKKLESLKGRLERVTKERDSMRSLIEANPGMDDMLARMDLEEDEEEAAVEDGFLVQSLVSLKEREIEDRLMAKYSTMYAQQRKLFEELRAWDSRQSEAFYKAKLQNTLAEFRDAAMAGIQQFADDPAQSRAGMDVMNVVIDRLEALARNQLPVVPTIPVSEANVKMDELKMQLTTVQNENEAFKRTIEGLGGLASPGNKAIIDGLGRSVAAQASEIARLKSERQKSTQLAAGPVSFTVIRHSIAHLLMHPLLRTKAVQCPDDAQIHENAAVPGLQGIQGPPEFSRTVDSPRHEAIKVDPIIRQTASEIAAAHSELRLHFQAIVSQNKVWVQQLKGIVREMMRRFAAGQGTIEVLTDQVKIERSKAIELQKSLFESEEQMEELQIKLKECLSRIGILQTEKELAENKIVVLTESEADANRSIAHISGVLLGLRDECNKQLKELENMRIHLDALETEKCAKLTRRRIEMEITSPPFLIFSSHPTRVRITVSSRPASPAALPRSSGATIRRSNYPGLIPMGQPPEAPAVVLGESMRFREADANMQFFRNLERRVGVLQKQLLEKTGECQAVRDRLHDANQLLFKAGVLNQRATREVRKLTLLHDRTKQGLTRAVAMISERDQDVVGLRRKVFNFHRIAGRVVRHIDEKCPELKDANEAFARVLVAFHDDDVLVRMAREEIISMQRVEQQRKKFVQIEQQKIMGALGAMCFLTQNTETYKQRPPTVKVSRLSAREKPAKSRKKVVPARAPR